MRASHAPQILTYKTFKPVPGTLNYEADIKAIQERVVEEATIPFLKSGVRILYDYD
jgi:hypothetical protein